MRVLGFSERWQKLSNPEFTTFRFKRKDKDWEVGEVVQVVYKPRRKGGGEFLGIAEIVSKEPRCMAWHGSDLIEPKITNEEAIADGFPDGEHKGRFKEGYFFMWEWLWDAYGGKRLMEEPMNKLTLVWIKT